jgi:hypothetical protein
VTAALVHIDRDARAAAHSTCEDERFCRLALQRSPCVLARSFTPVRLSERRTRTALMTMLS